MIRRAAALLLVAALVAPGAAAPTVRVKDIARLAGARDNQLVGYGLVVGLAATGDSARSRFTVLSVLSMLERLGIKMDQRTIESKNVAAVIVTATLPPYASSGQKIDVTIATIGDASSLDGGILLQTPIQGADGKIYAVAQGAVSIGGGAAVGAGAAGAAGRGGQHKTTARLPNAALIETEIRSDVIDAAGNLVFLLKNPDNATAARLADAINAAYRPPIARAENAERVLVAVPQNFRSNPVPFIARIEDLLLQPDIAARVIVNERTGTIVFGENCRISTVAVSHGGLSVTIRGEVAPNALPGAAPAAATIVEESKENTLTLQEGSNVRDLVRALNSIGATPRDIIAVLQAISRAGALHADLEFI